MRDGWRAKLHGTYMDALALVITSAITLVGLYLAHNLRRQQRLRIAEQRVTAYRQLWNLNGDCETFAA